MTARRRLGTPRPLLLSLLAALILAGLASAAPASAAGVWWHFDSTPAPTNLPPGGKAQTVATVTNLGYATAEGTEANPIKVIDTIPAGLKVVPGSARGFDTQARNPTNPSVPCVEAGQVITCSLPRGIPPYGGVTVIAEVQVEAAEGSSLSEELKVEGGVGNPSGSRTLPLNVHAATTQFGVERYEFTPENEDGTLDSQAGSHPFQLTTNFNLNQRLELNSHAVPPREEGAAPALVRDLHFVLPPGELGNVTIVPQCSATDFTTITPAAINLCPANTALGVARVTINEPNIFQGVVTETVPVFNLKPAPGEPARFGIELDKVPIVLNTRVRTGSDYAVEVSAINTSQAVGVLDTQLSFWGIPGDSRHDAARGWECVDNGRYTSAAKKPCVPLGEASPRPFLTNSTACGPASTTVTGRSWPSGPLGATTFTLAGEYKLPSGFTGCELLPFSPTIGVEPDTHSTSSPTGLTVKIDVPQDSTLSATGLAEGTVEATRVALPQGVQASPGAANGLLTCETDQFGLEGIPESSQVDNRHFSPGAIKCPDASKIGSVAIKTPDLENELTGGVYLAHQNTNPFGSPLVLYIFAEDPVSGVKVKLAGDVDINQTTGQLTSTFVNTPPVPFESLTLKLFGGGRASQATPAQCGDYKTDALFQPWSKPEVPGSASFSITSGPGGGPCPSNPQPFGPSLAAGATETTKAGAFSGFSVTLAHSDSDQPMNGIEVHLPLGAAGMISSVTPCSEPPVGQEWNCGADSLIGKTSSSSGFGSTPFTLPGKAYLTTGYNGAPFGLLVSTNAEHAGPFNLGVINVRSRINVDKNTAQVTTTTDPGPRNEIVPTMIKGVPVDLKQISVTIDRSKFTFNPTNCSPLSTTGTLRGAQGGLANVSAPFSVTGCDQLPFKPKLTASTQGNASKANGASLKVKVEAAPGEANIAKTKLVLPITLPSRLTTIQKACRDTVFEVNPAACDEGSNIGTATVHTPVLKNPLSGPAYLVSHGNAGFPDVEFVLQGEGITLILDGQTDIKKGITTSTFNAVPDAPVTTFETTLPEGPHSALTSNVPESKHFSLCGQKLVIPTTITGQNGAVIQQETKVPVTGCGAVLGSRETPLAKALKKCRKQFKHSKKKRAACEKQAHKRYDKKKKGKKKSKKKK
jgi:uncharacterized repeat protein (TIGR01451 family)